MSVRVIYLAHPVAGDVKANLASARRWIRWIVDNYTDIAICAPRIPYVESLRDECVQDRLRGTRDDLEILARCDEVWLVGDRVSSGMEAEKTVAMKLGKPILDLTGKGLGPT